MNRGIGKSEPQRDDVGIWRRLSATFGATAAGLVCGALSALVALRSMAPLSRNSAATYAQYPSVHHPWLAVDLNPPSWVSAIALIVGLAAAVSLGAAAAWLVRPRDVWADLSAGLTAALAGTLAAFVTSVGWGVMIALVIVPSLLDLHLLQDSGPTAASINPDEAVVDASKQLTARYPDLERVAPDKRRQMLLPKIVADQVTGGANAIMLGMLMSFFSIGSLALCGTLAAGYLGRRREGFRRTALPYLEMTVPMAMTVTILSGLLLLPVWQILLGNNPFAMSWLSTIGVVGVSVLMIRGVIRRWPRRLRLGLAITWVLAVLNSPFSIG